MKDWNSAQVRRWLETEGFRDFWHYLEPHAPITGQDVLSLTADDWHKLFQEDQKVKFPSIIRVRRLLSIVSKFKTSLSNNGMVKAVTSENSQNDEDSDVYPSDEDSPSGAKVLPETACRYCMNQSLKLSPREFLPERWKTFCAVLYALFVSWISAFVMVIVHDRVPDMEKYPPLPDIILDNIPHIPWAFEMCEVTGMILSSLWFLVVLFHKHRFILMRRFFSIGGTIFMLRCVTMLITSLSVPGTHLDCQPRPYGDVWNKLHNAYVIWSGGGMSLQGVRTCGDYMFSGHTVTLTLLNFFITEYTSRRIYFLHTFTWICNVFGVFFILAAHEHYSIDVFVAFYITSRLFMYYHMLANKTKRDLNLVKSKETSYEAQRTWFWFPLFSFFESSIDAKIPNEFAWPLTTHDIKEAVKAVQEWWTTLTFSKKEDLSAAAENMVAGGKKNAVKKSSKVKTK